MKQFLRITFLSIGMLASVAYLIFAVFSIVIYLVDSVDYVPLYFLIIMAVHAVAALTVTVAGIVRAVKKCKWVLLSGFFMQVWLAWTAFWVLLLILMKVLYPAIFLGFSVLIFIVIHAIANLAKNPQKSSFISGFNSLFILSTEDSLVDTIPEYCKKFNKDEKFLTESDNDLIFEYAFNWVLYLVIWIIKNDYYSESFKNELGDALIAEVKSDIVIPEKLLGVTSGMLTDSEVCEALKPFLSEYAESYRKGSYWEDYLEVIRSEQSRYYYISSDDEYLKYCINFNMNIYYDIEDRINRSYFNFKHKINDPVLERLHF